MDKALKQRLVGASVLIILAVIVLPMLLSGRSDRLQQESREIELPPKPEELSIETRRFPVGVANKPAPAATQESVTAEAGGTQKPLKAADIDTTSAHSERPDATRQQGSGTGTNSVASAQAEDMQSNESADIQTDSAANTEVKPAEVTSIVLSSGRDKGLDKTEAAETSRDTPRYLVQVASFSSEQNANVLASRLQADGLPVLMDVVDRTAGRLHRVRIGPYAERSDADAVVSGLRSTEKDLTPRVLDLRPADSAPVSNPSDPLVRWVVQVGSFSNAKSAETLVAELRLAGLTAFSEEVTAVNGTVYKVRIGPELDRNRAMELARKVKPQHPDAFVTTQE
jgi:DedD protein